MSDIDIRLDGLLLALLIAVGAGMFLVIALVSAVWTLWTTPAGVRSWKIARRGLCLALTQTAAFLVLLLYLDAAGSAQTGPDWIDWLAVPWAGLTLFGLVWLFRGRASPPRADARDLG